MENSTHVQNKIDLLSSALIFLYIFIRLTNIFCAQKKIAMLECPERIDRISALKFAGVVHFNRS
jgi:hypothetical protein